MRDIVYTISRWFLYLIILFLACYLFYSRIYLVHGPKVVDVDARLPTPLHSSPSAFWSWFFGSAFVAGGVGYWTIRVHRALRLAPLDDDTEPADDDGELVAAVAAIANLRRGHEREPWYLIIGEGEGPLALLEASGLGPDATAPPDPAPLRGLRTADGLFVQCSGPDSRGAIATCRNLAASSDAPPLRGIVAQVPVATMLGPRSRAAGQAVRAILRDVAEISATRCPVYVVVSGMEEIPGFLEFARRSPAEYRISARFGFALPEGDESTRDRVARDYDRLVAWFNLAVFDFMEAGPLQQDGNEALFALGHWFLRAREPMLQFLEHAQPEGDDPFEILNCYFAATGAAPDLRAFTESLMQVKVVGDARSIRWSRATCAADDRLRRWAVGLGAGAGTLALLAWGLIWFRLRPNGWLDPALVLAIVVGWGLTWYELFRGFKRRRKPTR